MKSLTFPIVTEAEVRYGLAERPDATTLHFLVNSFLASIRVVPRGSHDAEVYGTVRASLERQGLSLGTMDMMIASHAIATGAVLVTNDKALGQVDVFGEP